MWIVYAHRHPHSWASLLSPIPRRYHQAPGWAPCALQPLPCIFILTLSCTRVSAYFFTAKKTEVQRASVTCLNQSIVDLASGSGRLVRNTTLFIKRSDSEGWDLVIVCSLKLLFFEHLLYVVVVQSLSDIQLFATPWTVARQASLSFTTTWRLLRFMSSESVMPSNHPILCRPLLLLSSVLPSTRVFSNESAVCIRWPKIGASASSLVLQWIFRVDIL